jgi:hypothetical protein
VANHRTSHCCNLWNPRDLIVQVLLSLHEAAIIHMYYVNTRPLFSTSSVADIFVRTKQAAKLLHKDSYGNCQCFYENTQRIFILPLSPKTLVLCPPGLALQRELRGALPGYGASS